MEEIEYLEEYEDLVLPALNSAAAAASTVSTDATKLFKNSQNQKFNDDGNDSSSSLDQDIFNCLFDDNSDDDDEDDYNTYEQGGENNIKQVEVLRQDQKSKTNTFDKEANKISSSTPKPKTFAAKTSGTTISINRAQSTFANKPKSVATVRPTVQNQLYHTKQKKTNTIQRSTTTSFIQQQHQQHQQRPTTSTASTSRSHQLPILARKPLSTATASSSSSTLVGKKITLPSPSLKANTIVKKVAKRPATIVKPEKIITKDPVNDPLNLDDLSEIGSDNYSLSDISGETYNTISEFDDDDSNDEYYSGDNIDYYDDADDDNISSSSQIIELSNDSSGSQTKLEDLRAPTPSPVISDDSDTSSSLFNLKLRKPCSTKPYSHPIIIESVLKKGDKPKLLDLLRQYNLLDDSVENDSGEEANVVIDITRSKENLLENLEVDTAQRASSPPTPVDVAIVVDNKKSIKAKPATGCSTSSVSTDKNKSKKKRLKKMDHTNSNRDSTDSDLSAVEELLEESYAEAMKRIKDAPLSSQEVGAELEIGGEEEVTSVEVVKNPLDNKLKQTKPGIVIDYDDNPLEQESTNSKKAENSPKEELETKQNNADEEKERIKKVIEKEIELEIKKEIGQKSTELEKIESSDKTSKDLNETKSNEITDITESSSSKPTKNNKEKPSLDEITMTTSSKSEDIVKEGVSPEDSAERISVPSDSLNIRKKKRFRNLITPDPSDPATAVDVPILKSLDDDNDFKGFDDGEKVTEDGQKLKTKIVEEQALDKSLETKTNKAKDDSSASFKSPTSSHKSLHDKHKETKEKTSSRDSSRDSSKDRNSKEAKSKSSRESSKEKSSRENSKDSSSRENSKDRSRESSKDRSKTFIKDYKDHRKSNDSKESSRSRESSKSRDSKDTKHSKSDTKDFHRHSNDKKDKTHETTKEKLGDKTKTLGSDNKDTKDCESKKTSKDDKESSEKNSDALKPKNLTEEVNKMKAKEDDIGKTTKATPTKEFKNSNIQKKSTDSPTVSSSSKNSSCSTSRDSSKDRKEIKKPMESSIESLDRIKVGNASTLPGDKMKTNKPISTKTVSNTDGKQKDKVNVTQKSSDSIKDCKSVKSDTKPVKENKDLKAQMSKSNDSKASESNVKNTKPNLIVKNVVPTKTTTQSPNVKPMIKSGTSLNKSTTSLNKSNTSLNKSTTGLNKSTIGLNKSNTSLNKSTTSLNKSTTSLNKSTTSLNKSNTSLNKSNTNLDKTVQKLSDSKINKDPNSKTVTADLKVKSISAKPTSEISDKSNISKPALTTYANKTPKKVSEDKKVLQNDDNANKDVPIQQRDSLVDPNKKSSSDAANKPINKTQDANKDLRTEITSKTINKIESKNDHNKALSTPERAKGTNITQTKTQSAANNSSNIKKPTLGVDSKSVIKNVKDDAKPNTVNKSPSNNAKKLIKKPDENKQKDKADICKKVDLKPNLKTTSEKPPTKEIKNISEDNDKSDLKPKPVIIKAKAESVQKKSEPIKTKNPAGIKSDNVGLKKSAEMKPPVSGGIQMDKNIPKTETIKQGDVLVKNKTGTIKTQQQSKEEDIKTEATDKSDLKLKMENKTDSVKSNKSEESPAENKEATKSLPREVKSISGNQTDTTKTTKSEESSKENENKTQSKYKPTVSVPKVESKSETQIDSSKTTKPKESCKENENKSQLKHKLAVSEAEVKSKSGNQTDSPKPQEICRENEKEIEPKPRASEPNIKVKILNSKKSSVNNPEAKADSIKESSKVCDKKGTETKTAKGTEKPLSSSSSSNDKEVEKKSLKEELKKDELKVSEKTLKTTNNTEGIEDSVQEESLKESVEMKKCNETSIKPITTTVKGDGKVNKSEPVIKPNISSKSIKDQETNEVLKEGTEKQKLSAETEETIESRVTRSRMEIIKANEDIDDPTNSGKCADLKLDSKEVGELKLEPSKTELDEEIKTLETTIDKDIKTDDTRTIVELNQAKIPNQKCEDKAKEEDTSLKEEKENVELCGEKNPDKDELKDVEPMRTRNRSKILIDDGKSQGLETPPPLVDAKNQICDVKPEDLKLKESKSKEGVSDVITTEGVPKENKFEPIRTRKRADNKSDTEEHFQSEVICEKLTIELKDKPGSSSMGIRTRKHVEIEGDEQKLTEKSGASTIEAKILAVDEKSTTAGVAKLDGDNFEPKRTRKCLNHKADESTNKTIKDQMESEENIEDTATEHITEKTSLEKEKANEQNFEPVRTRKRGDVKASDMDLKESAEVSSEDKKDTGDHMNKEMRTRKRGDVVKSVDLKHKESSEISDNDKKDQTSKEIVAKADDLNKKDFAETSEKVQKDIKNRKNKEISEPTITRKRVEAFKSTDLNQKESTKTSEDNERGATDQTNLGIIEPIKTRKRGEVVKPVNSNQKESSQTLDEAKNDLKVQTIKEIIIGPIKTRNRGDGKATVLNTNEVLDQTTKETIESVKPKKITEVQSAVVNEKMDVNKLEPIKTRKRLDINDDFKQKESKEQTNEEMLETVRTRRRLEDKSFTSIEKAVEEKSGDIPARNRADNKTEDLKVIKKNYKEAENEQHITTTDNEQSKQDTLDRNDAIETSSDTSISSDYSLKRILRKRGTESPLSENDNKKLFKEPTVKSIHATIPKSAKDEKPLTNVVATGSKRNLRSPVSEASSPITVKKAKLDVPRKTTRFRNLHDDCLEEEELPVITASDSAVTTELENLNAGAPKELEEKHQLTKKAVRKEVSESKNIKSQLDQESIQNVVTDREKSTSETETKNLPRKEVKEIETVQNTENTKSLKSNSTTNLKVKPISVEGSSSLQNNEKQNIPERSEYKKVKANTSPTKSAGSSSVLSFSDWLKTKKQSTKLDDNLEEKSVQSTTTTEKSAEKTNENIRIKAKPMPKVVDTQDQHKLSEGSEKKESLIDNTQKNKTREMAGSKSRRGRWRNKSNNTANNNQSKTGNPNATTTTAANSKNSQLDVQDDNSCDSKIKVEKLQAPTPTLVRVKKREIQVLIDSMSKEMKDGGISDLLNTETHVKRQRLATKRNFSGSSENLNTSSNITTKELTATVKSATTAGTVLSKDVPKVIEFGESTEMLASSSKELNRSPSRRKQQQNATKSTKATGHKSTTHYVDSNSDMKLRKSLNPKDLTSHTSSREVLSPSIATRPRKSMPQTKETNIEKISSVREEKTTYLKTRRTLPSMKEPSNVQEKGVNKNISPVFKAPKPVVHTAVFNAMRGQGSLEKLHVEDNKRPQSRNKKPSKVVKTFKCREVRVRLNRSKVKKYLSVLHDRNNQVTASSGKTVEDDSSIIQNNADSNLHIQSVVDKRNLMDLSADYNPNNVFVPQDSYMQTNITSDTMPMEPTLPSVSLANQSYEAAPISSHTMASLPIINAADPSEHIELKNEFMDENPIDLVNEALLPDTPTLLARAQTITEAAQHALAHSVAPTDIRLLTTESTGNAFVPSFGVIPTALDNRGTCMYTFLHPAKYNRNHSNVLLDYCCPNLDGPMPAIDPTRIHAQVQVPVIELPASIVLTTKIVTRADLESENSTVPAIIRRKAEKIRNNLAAHHKVATAASVASTTQQPQPYTNSVMQPQSSTTRFPLPPTINALTKQLPATTTITAKIRPTQHQDVVAQSHTISKHTTTSSSTTTPINTNAGVVSVIPKGPPQLSQLQKSSLRSNLRRFDILLKQLVQPFDNLTFVDRHRIIEAIISAGKLLPKDLDRTISLMEEYIKQTTLINNDKINTQTLTAPIPLPSATTTISTNNYHMTNMTQAPNSCSLSTMQMPQLQPSPQLLAPASASTSAASSYCRQQMEQLHTKTVKTVQTSSSTAGTPAEGTVIKQRQVPIYDAERNIIGYQMKMITPMASVPAHTKSTMSTHTGAIMSTSLDSSSNKTISYTVSKRPVKRPAQDSPRVFYTTPPLQTSTPKGITNPTQMYPTTQKQSTNSKAIAQKTQKGSIVTTLRSGGSSASSASSETITTTTMATVKRVTRSTATGSKIIIVSKSNQSNEETILPDTNNQQQPEIKNEKDIEEFLG